MDPKRDEAIFLGYSINRRTYKVYNKCTKKKMESIKVVIDDTPRDKKRVKDEDENSVSPQ